MGIFHMPPSGDALNFMSEQIGQLMVEKGSLKTVIGRFIAELSARDVHDVCLHTMVFEAIWNGKGEGVDNAHKKADGIIKESLEAYHNKKIPISDIEHLL